MRAAIIDIDGTLADCRHRLHFVKHGRRDWNSFFALMGEDGVHEPIRDVLHALRNEGAWIVLCSGRPEGYRAVTEAWLADNDIPFSALYMRPAGDTRPDHIVKSQLLDGILEDGFEPFVVIDDRQSVVDMWRERGLTCLQCAPSDAAVPDTAVLTLMVGPSGAGKTHWLWKSIEAVTKFGLHPDHLVSSDCIRRDLCGNFQDQSKNDAVFDALHAVAKVRLKHGLPTAIDATNIRRKDRVACATLAPPECPVRYIVLDRPLAEKRATGGWRNEIVKDGVPFDLIGKHHETFQAQLKDILRGDGLPNVTVFDLRKYPEVMAEAA